MKKGVKISLAVLLTIVTFGSIGGFGYLGLNSLTQQSNKNNDNNPVMINDVISLSNVELQNIKSGEGQSLSSDKIQKIANLVKDFYKEQYTITINKIWIENDNDQVVFVDATLKNGNIVSNVTHKIKYIIDDNQTSQPDIPATPIQPSKPIIPSTPLEPSKPVQPTNSYELVISNPISTVDKQPNAIMAEKVSIKTNLFKNGQTISNSDASNYHYTWAMNNQILVDENKPDILGKVLFNKFGQYTFEVKAYKKSDLNTPIATKTLVVNVDYKNIKEQWRINLETLMPMELNMELQNKIPEFANNNFTKSDIHQKVNQIYQNMYNDNKYQLNFIGEPVIDHQAKNISLKYQIRFLQYEPHQSVYSQEHNLSFDYTVKDNNQPIQPPQQQLNESEKIIEKVKLIPAGGKYDHKTLTAKEFLKLDMWSYVPGKNPKDYLVINEKELKQQFSTIMKDTTIRYSMLDKFDVTKPTTVFFEIEVVYDNAKTGVWNQTRKIIEINDFKRDDNLIGKLDAQPIKTLVTPNNATSYKGLLPKFRIDEFAPITENAYRNELEDFSWSNVKLNFMYQVRFALYQMFSDNFSEINYYIADEVDELSFNAIAEGIIKEDKITSYGFFYQGYGPGFKRNQHLKKGDKVKIEIKYSLNEKGKYQPGFIDDGSDWLGEFAYSWHWNFEDNCNDFFDNDKNSPLYVRNIPRDNWTTPTSNKIGLGISVNGQYTYKEDVNQYSSYNFVLRRKFG